MITEQAATNDTLITNKSQNGKYVVTVENRQDGTKFTAYKGNDFNRAKRMFSEVYRAVQTKILSWK